MAEQKSGYDKSKDKILGKFATKSDKRYLNIVVYSYDGGPVRIRITPANANTNPNAEPNKKWIQQKGISQISKEEAEQLIIGLEKALACF